MTSATTVTNNVWLHVIGIKKNQVLHQLHRFPISYVFGSVLVLLLVYWVPATLYTIVDLFKPAWLYKYKVKKIFDEWSQDLSQLNGQHFLRFNQKDPSTPSQLRHWQTLLLLFFSTRLDFFQIFPQINKEQRDRKDYKSLYDLFQFHHQIRSIKHFFLAQLT